LIITLKFNDILNDFELQYKPFGEHSILIEWPQIISENILENVLTYKQNIEKYNFEQKVYVKSAYNSILITYDVAIVFRY
jgi:inhibitor of KinA